jgi:hypothetical protein
MSIGSQVRVAFLQTKRYARESTHTNAVPQSLS